MLQKEYADVGSVKKVTIQTMLIKDLIAGSSIKALRFEYEAYSSIGSDTKVAALDQDEIDGLIKSLRIIKEKIVPNQVTNYTEVFFRSRSGFEAGCFSSGDSWKAYLKLERFDSRSMVFLSVDDLDKLLSMVEAAKAKLM